jgi:hypothetical protein
LFVGYCLKPDLLLLLISLSGYPLRPTACSWSDPTVKPVNGTPPEMTGNLMPEKFLQLKEKLGRMQADYRGMPPELLIWQQ